MGNACTAAQLTELDEQAVGKDAEPLQKNNITFTCDDVPGNPPEDLGVVGNCFICLPAASVRILGISPNMDDKAATEKTLWFGRAWQLRSLALARYRRLVLGKQPKLSRKQIGEIEEAMKDPRKRELMLKVQKIWRGAVQRNLASLSCVLSPLCYHTEAFNGTVLFMHGSGGMTYNNVRYCRKLASFGYLVIGPDSMAGGEHRKRDLAGLIKSSQETPYWGDLGVYTSDAHGAYTYSTQAEAVTADADKFKTLYENVYRMRSAEMHWILGRLPTQVVLSGVFTMGQSEGAMTVARFDDQRYGAMIRGRIISAFSVEYCYFTPSRAAGTFGGNPEVPTLNLIGDADQYFGPVDSVAKKVIEDKKTGGAGWGSDNLTGNAFKEMKRQRLRRGLVAVMEGAKHDASETHDNFLRDMLRAFLASPADCQRIPERWKRDDFLKEHVKVLEEDTEGAGIRMLLKVARMPFLPEVAYSKELIMRDSWASLGKQHNLEIISKKAQAIA